MAKIYAYDDLTLEASEFKDSYVECLNSMRGSAKELKSFMAEMPESEYYMIVIAGKVIGCARVSNITPRLQLHFKLIISQDEDAKFVSSVYIKEEFRGKKYAKKLMLAIKKIHNRLVLEALANNTTAVMMYFKCGLKVVDSRPLNDDYVLLFSTPNVDVKYAP